MADLKRTRLAEVMRKRVKSGTNTVLQHGGLLTVDDARRIKRQLDSIEQTKLDRVVKRQKRLQEKPWREWFAEAARVAREWRRAGGKLGRCEVVDERGKRLVFRI